MFTRIATYEITMEDFFPELLSEKTKKQTEGGKHLETFSSSIFSFFRSQRWSAELVGGLFMVEMLSRCCSKKFSAHFHYQETLHTYWVFKVLTAGILKIRQTSTKVKHFWMKRGKAFNVDHFYYFEGSVFVNVWTVEMVVKIPSVLYRR